jgi:hypothetical protein
VTLLCGFRGIDAGFDHRQGEDTIMRRRLVRAIADSSLWALALAATAYGAYVGATWLRYGCNARATADEADPLLDEFMPEYDVVERHHIFVAAPAEVTFAKACELDMMQSAIVRAVFRLREFILRTMPQPIQQRGILEFTQSLGWQQLAKVENREIVMGAVTRPWDSNVVFRPVAPEQFLGFEEPNYVKIAWTLRADQAGPQTSIFRHETRVITTDARARDSFRTYWAFFSPGIKLIRLLLLGPVRKAAEAAVHREN